MRALPTQRHNDRRQAFTPLWDLMTNKPALLCSAQRRQRGGQLSPLTVERASDNARLAIPFTEGGFVNTGSIRQHCGAAVGSVYRLEDATGGGNHLANTVNAQQPRVWDGSALDVSGNGRLALRFDGVNDLLGVASTFGISGDANVTIAVVAKLISLPSSGVLFSFGNSATNKLFGILFSGTDTANVYAWQNGSHREFAVSADPTTAWRRWVATSTAGLGAAGNTMREDGVTLTQSGLLAGTKNMGTTPSYLGAYIGGSLFANMSFTFLGVWASVLTGGDLAAVEAEMLAHV